MDKNIKENKKEKYKKINLKLMNYFYILLQTHLTYFSFFYIKVK